MEQLNEVIKLKSSCLMRMISSYIIEVVTIILKQQASSIDKMARLRPFESLQ
jgi:hypothetical protein